MPLPVWTVTEKVGGCIFYVQNSMYILPVLSRSLTFFFVFAII